jgi:hypothetical protein
MVGMRGAREFVGIPLTTFAKATTDSPESLPSMQDLEDFICYFPRGKESVRKQKMRQTRNKRLLRA